MIDELTPESIVSEVRLLREDANYQGAFLFVEGDTDAALFSNFIDRKKCIIRMVKGRNNVLKLIEIMNTAHDPYCLAIVDADFWYIEKKIPSVDGILATDTHDIETMIFRTPAFEKVMSEYLTIEKINSLQDKYPDLRTPILTVASKMAMIRWVSHSNNLRINFYADQNKTQPLDWAVAINIDRFEVNFEKLLDIVCWGDYGFKMRLRPRINECQKNKYDLFKFCNGHDVIYVILLFFKRNGRRRDTENLSGQDLEKSLRLAYEVGFFKETALYANLIGWQQRKGLNILKI